ncbi:MAG: SprT family zinc-dependent metalloprotease, partial [Anaerolineales bacterium]
KQGITIDGIHIELERKRVKNVNLTIYPPDGRVRISAPHRMSEKKLHQVIRSKLPWIKRHRTQIKSKAWVKPYKYVSGERHAFMGEVYQLDVIQHDAAPSIEIQADDKILLRVRRGSSREKREKVLREWYRAELKKLIPPLIARWEPVIGVEVAEWGVKRMKTRWGSCNTKAHRIWVNLELAKHPIERLEYIVVHEMVHLLEHRHNKRFYAYMDRFLPEWRQHREALKVAPNSFPSRIG